jgi:arabinose-5-phosphate isomerase
MGDALAVVLFEEKGFSEEDFARLHPGGALGRRLQTVAALMHTGNEVPIVPTEMPLKDALLVISAKRLGVTGVTDGRGASSSACGVITTATVPPCHAQSGGSTLQGEGGRA